MRLALRRFHRAPAWSSTEARTRGDTRSQGTLVPARPPNKGSIPSASTRT